MGLPLRGRGTENDISALLVVLGFFKGSAWAHLSLAEGTAYLTAILLLVAKRRSTRSDGPARTSGLSLDTGSVEG
jgi:hypothetical protein